MIAIIFFIFGLCIGSFLNVVAYRVPKKISIVTPPSTCPNCKKQIKPYNNIPVLSYLILRGRCADCGWKIPLKYPLIEFSTGLLFAASYYFFGLVPQLAGALVLVSLLVAITVVDLELQIIPDKLIMFGLETGFFLWLVSLVSRTTKTFKFDAIPLVKIGPIFNTTLLWSWIGLLGGTAAVIIIAVVSQWFLKAETMGGGDIKLAALVGFYAGPYVFLVIGFSFIFGALVTVPLLALGKIKRKQPVPFGPFIALAALMVIFFGPAIWHWYVGFLV
jgi:leader peptidase (prepilin peptidase)/N-methyltransferase